MSYCEDCGEVYTGKHCENCFQFRFCFDCAAELWYGEEVCDSCGAKQ